MPSIDRSRRRLLAAGGSLSAVIAGCTGFSESESIEHNVTEGGEPMPSDEYESLTLRADGAEPFVYPDGEPPEDGEKTGSRPYERSVEFVLSDDEASAIRIDADDEDVDDARTFLEATDFETESVVIDQREIEDCYRRHLLSVQANPDEFRTQFCQSLKAPTTPCEADVTVMEAVFVRVQRAYEAAPSSRASSESRSCPPSERAVTDGERTSTNDTATDEEGGR
ncbi:hypothetical protein RBH26_00190 [Natronolimnohabitans sp. A-GB9]|uniref:hypothetical protein n=1 Tax=Natronolimnohabitans sp. A-GB9 TaxID=3069757 RepID=UPI0027B52A9A|nr:hypothetical protein [Natronolimnohabitans sp. A-GB9]MDQ2048896.1 hypothetical protein [Natronolimnohabitans sp. A-GB9]